MLKNNALITELDKERILKLLKEGYSLNSNQYLSASFEKEIKKAKALKSEKIPSDVITMRSKFRLKDLGTGQRYEYTLVYPQEADSAEKISILAIYGPAVFGSRKGDVVRWDLENGTKFFQVDEVIYQPEASGHWDL
ncbi:MAG: GreA/GreB family elongation factor [Leptospiraceae bacterium]|nr:GreA/GreB family elongation factor [Leptospiraceae bacterium]